MPVGEKEKTFDPSANESFRILLTPLTYIHVGNTNKRK
jgi:hypothetical protein